MGCHVWCWLARRQHNGQRMQFTRGRETLVKSRKPAPGAFRKKVRDMQCERIFLRGKGGNIIGVKHAILGHAAEAQRIRAIALLQATVHSRGGEGSTSETEGCTPPPPPVLMPSLSPSPWPTLGRAVHPHAHGDRSASRRSAKAAGRDPPPPKNPPANAVFRICPQSA